MGCNQSAETTKVEPTQRAVVASPSTRIEVSQFGKHIFKGAIAAPYLEKQGLPGNTLESPAWVTNGMADKVAAAVLDWARDNGASVYCHWFQPMASYGVRHGLTGGLYNHMFAFAKDGSPEWDFDGKMLLKGETDGSSYPNGGLRQTHSAAAYLSIDTTSPIFLRGDAIFIPACMVSYHGHALDEKTPLLRASEYMSEHGTRLLSLLGYKVKGLITNIGLEQELFLIPRDAFNKRLDLQLTGRTVIGRMPPRGQEMKDHYMAPPSWASPALKCMQEIQETCFKMGIPLRTRHREVAPNQYEFAPLYGFVTTQIDQNLVVMQVIEEIAIKHGLAALFQEKPFQGVNGSGKHNNWSIGTTDGVNLLNVGQLAAKSGSAEIFPIIMAAIVKAVDQHADLMRLSIAVPGNDFRLGACEAPPAIISTYLGENMTSFLDAYRKGADTLYSAEGRALDMGAKAIAPLTAPSEDRNRTSPFPYGGHRFEFRAVGSSQNNSLVNTVLATICGDAFKEFADAIESGAKPKDVARQALNDHWKVIFNGNGYDPENQAMLTNAGLCRIDSGVEAMCVYTSDKNISLFERAKVLSKEECFARKSVLLEHYVGTIEMEAQCMIDMIVQNIIPSLLAAPGIPGHVVETLHADVSEIKAALADIHHTIDEKLKATLARNLRLETMLKIREHCDGAEGLCPANLWTLATYKDLLFLDHTR